MLTPATLAAIDSYWAAELGVPPELLRQLGVHTMALAGGMADYRGAYLLRRELGVVFTLPARLVESAHRAVQACPPETVFDPAFLADLFASSVERIIGPAYQGFVDAATFRPVDGRGTRLLTAADFPALERLRAACDETEWMTTAISLDRHELTFGCFDGGELVSAGMIEERGEDFVFVRIITHPDRRGQGYGRAVVSAMTDHALEHGLVPRYQTLLANTASIAIAHSLGYVEYGATLAVRLHGAGLL